ncbi:MAG: dTDP-4-dehydrorhamnose reductase [Tannerellaceae bacterium]|jgi:dTDP-4-dehydrorhamnose reductase|nr:dTDP-4-dehydrorhamnose reductase [Tannerellaceae bacterium]
MHHPFPVIAVTGAAGQLGRALQQQAPADGNACFHYTDLPDLDICSLDDVRRYVATHHIEVVINAAAYTAVDRAEADEADAMRINADGVRNLAIAMSEVGGRIIHISTDYVFDGLSPHPYLETDPTHPLSAYGRTKLAGEQALQDIGVPAVIIRTAWLYSEVGNNFLRTMLRLGRERSDINVVSDQVGTPTYAPHLADAIHTILRSPFVSGIYHYSNDGVCSWYDFARKIIQLADLPCRVHPIETKDYPTPAVRPAYSVLSKTKIKQTYGIEGHHWEEPLLQAITRIKT